MCRLGKNLQMCIFCYAFILFNPFGYISFNHQLLSRILSLHTQIHVTVRHGHGVLCFKGIYVAFAYCAQLFLHVLCLMNLSILCINHGWADLEVSCTDAIHIISIIPCYTNCTVIVFGADSVFFGDDHILVWKKKSLFYHDICLSFRGLDQGVGGVVVKHGVVNSIIRLAWGVCGFLN